MNRRLKDHMTHDGQSAADALQVDLLRLVGQEATTENSEAAEATIRRCSSCNLIPLAGELQVGLKPCRTVFFYHVIVTFCYFIGM